MEISNRKDLVAVFLLSILIITLGVPLIIAALSYNVTIPISGTVNGESKNLGNLGTYNKWSKVEFQLIGPESTGTQDFQNPFKTIVDVTFTSPSNNTFVISGFYDGDGNGGIDGNKWKVRFCPNELGTWSFESNSINNLLTDYRGTFTVSDSRQTIFQRVGRLEYVGEPYLKFAEGPYWIKGGMDDPENFLGFPFGSWENKKNEIDYLAAHGMNSIYIMFHNVEGDDNDVFPWLTKYDSEHFDVAKLALWEDFFEYVQNKGIVLHLVWEDDSAWTGFNRDLYYREMIARFSHHNCIIWNIAEEYNENYGIEEAKAMVKKIRELDPYDHPIAVHNWNTPNGQENFEVTSIQIIQTADQNALAIQWLESTDLVVSFDETEVFGPTDRQLARKIFWQIYVAGGNFELHLADGYRENYQPVVDLIDDVSRARFFMESLPFWEMSPANYLVLSGNAYVFSKKGIEYAAYLPYGGNISLDLTDSVGIFEYEWFNPRTGTYSGQSTIQGQAVRSFTAPDSADWVLHISKV